MVILKSKGFEKE